MSHFCLSAFKIHYGVPWWLSRLRIQCCHWCGSDGYCGAGSVPGLGTSTCHGCGWKKKRERNNRFTLCLLKVWLSSVLLGVSDCILLGICWASWMFVFMSVIKFGDFSFKYYFFDYFSNIPVVSAPFSLSSSGTPMMYISLQLMVFHRSLRLCSLFFSLFFFCSWALIVSIVLSSQSLILFTMSSNLPWNIHMIFSFQLLYFSAV